MSRQKHPSYVLIKRRVVRRRTFKRIGWTKERKKEDIWAAKKWTFERRIFRTFERIFRNWSGHL